MQLGVNNHAHASNLYNDSMNKCSDSKTVNMNLFYEWHKNHDPNAREELILRNTPMVYKLAQDYKFLTYNTAIYNMDDIISIGIIGLIKAIDTFDYTKGYAFTTYAYRVIQNHLEWEIWRVNRVNLQILSLDANSVIAENIQDLTVNIEDSVQYRTLVDILNSAMLELNPKHHMIINLYFGFNGDPITQQEIAEYMSISQGQVSRIIKATLKILRAEILKVI